MEAAEMLMELSKPIGKKEVISLAANSFKFD
jgi:hypothetical protein